MSDDRRELWEELMRSPLDDERRTLPQWVALVLIGAVAAVAAFTAVWVIRGGSPDPVAAPTTTTTTTVAASDGPRYPDGYTEVAEGVAARVIAVYQRTSTISVLVGTAVSAGSDRTMVPVLEPGWWTELPSGSPLLRETTDQLAVGFVTIEFPRRGDGVPTALAFNPVGSVEEGTIEWDDDSFPSEARGEDLAFSGNVFVLDSAAFHPGWGLVEWHVEGERPARARIAVEAVAEGTDDPATDGIDPTVFRSRYLAPQYPNQLHAPGTPTLDRQGSDQLVPVGEPITSANSASGVSVSIAVELATPAAERVDVPLDGAVTVIEAR